MLSVFEKFKSLVINETDAEKKNPELGFKVSLKENEALAIEIIAGKNLPTSFGFHRPIGYSVKVKVFPGRDKFETEIIKGSACPCFDQEFMFPLIGSANSNVDQQFSGKFVTFTVYAIFDQPESATSSSKLSTNSFRNYMDNMLSRNNDKATRRSINHRYSLNNRRTIGAITYSLSGSVFTEKNRTSTPNIWRDIENISSGVNIQTRESKKGSLEINMIYSNSEDGKHDTVQIALTKFRCSMQTMHEYEKLSGLLYFKMIVYEYDSPIGKWKGNTFLPTISMKIEAKSATLQATFNNYNINNIKIVIKLKCRNSLMEKTSVLGSIVISSGSQLWQQLTTVPTQPISEFFEFV